MDSTQPHASFGDVVLIEKQKAIALFHSFRRVAKLWKVLEAVVLLGMISWSAARVPTLLKTTVVHLIQFSAYLLNHHVMFLIGNAIIVLLVVLCRRSDGAAAAVSNLSSCGDGDLYDDYVKHSEAAAAQPHEDAVPPVVEEEKQIVLCSDESVQVEVPPADDDVAAAIDRASKQIKRFQRTQSEKLKRDISVRTLRRSETNNRRISGERSSEIETLSSAEFRRTVDAFIDKHWSKKNTKHNNSFQFDDDDGDQYRNKYYPFMNENVKSMIHVRG